MKGWRGSHPECGGLHAREERSNQFSVDKYLIIFNGSNDEQQDEQLDTCRATVVKRLHLLCVIVLLDLLDST